jgi:long-chain acyl-CoA synthetase
LEKWENPKEELSAKGEIIRFKIYQNYKSQINKMFHRENKKRKLSDILQNLIDG